MEPRSPQCFERSGEAPVAITALPPAIDYASEADVRGLVESGKLVAVEDTREQLPLRLDLPTIRRRLDTGDYSLIAYEEIISVERKSAADLIRCTARDRGRFDRCVTRLLEFPYPLMVIENPWAAIVSEARFGRVSPAFVERSCIEWMRKGLPIIFCASPLTAAETVQKFLLRSARDYDRMSKVQQEGAGRGLG